MASISRRKFKSKVSFRVCIKRQGIKRIYKSFNTRTEAKRWARNMEVKLDKGDYSDFTEASKLTLGDIAKRYIDGGYHRKKKGARYEEYRFGQLCEDTISGVNLLKLSSKHLAEYRDRRLKEVGPATFNKDFNFIGDDLYVIANSFSRPDEIFKLVNEKLERLSTINDDFNNKVKTFDCVYRRINTGQSEIDTWGIFVGKNKPTLLNIHGGPASQYGYTFFDEFQTYASAGFNVIACNPRGSTGRGHDFLRDVCGRKWGVNDVHDVLTSFKKMIKIMGIENKNYGIMGGSYGGFMTSWVIGHYPKMFKSAVVERALLNWETMVGTSDIGIGFPEMYLLDDMNNNLNLYRKKSPITYANNIITPTLIIHSEKDYRCPVEQAEQLFSNLKRRSIDTTMIRFPDESHELSRSGKPNHRIQRFEWIINWHKKQLK